MKKCYKRISIQYTICVILNAQESISIFSVQLSNMSCIQFVKIKVYIHVFYHHCHINENQEVFNIAVEITLNKSKRSPPFPIV